MKIKRDFNKISNPLSNPATGLLEDTITHLNVTQAKCAKGMGISRSLLNEVLKRKRGVSIDLALRAEAYLGISASVLVKLQAQYDYEKAYHEKYDEYASVIIPLECA